MPHFFGGVSLSPTRTKRATGAPRVTGATVLALMNGALALSAMGLIVIVVRAIYELTRKKVSQERRLIS